MALTLSDARAHSQAFGYDFQRVKAEVKVGGGKANIVNTFWGFVAAVICRSSCQVLLTLSLTVTCSSGFHTKQTSESVRLGIAGAKTAADLFRAQPMKGGRVDASDARANGIRTVIVEEALVSFALVLKLEIF